MSWQDLSPKIFGSRQPFSGQLTQIALVNSVNNAYVNIFVTNTGLEDPSVTRLVVKPLGEITQDKHYILYDTVLSPGETVIIPDIGLGPNSEIYGYSDNGNVNFNVTGQRINNYG